MAGSAYLTRCLPAKSVHCEHHICG